MKRLLVIISAALPLSFASPATAGETAPASAPAVKPSTPTAKPTTPSAAPAAKPAAKPATSAPAPKTGKTAADKWVEKREKKLVTLLTLTDKQKAAIHKELVLQRQQLDSVNRDAEARRTAINADIDAKINVLLSPTQKKSYATLRAKEIAEKKPKTEKATTPSKDAEKKP